MEEGAKIAGRKTSATAERTVRLPGRLMKRGLLLLSSEHAAPLLLGKLLVSVPRAGSAPLVGRIVEVEAYLGPQHTTPDPAAHSYRGPTTRNQVMFGPAGHAYVYLIYGMYFCMNVTCEPPGLAGCVLIRALEPVAGIAEMALNRGVAADAAPGMLTAGPGRLCEALDITRPAHNGLDLLDIASPLQLREDGFKVAEVLMTARIGIRHAADLPLRFAIPGNECVSGPRSLAGTRVPIG